MKLAIRPIAAIALVMLAACSSSTYSSWTPAYDPTKEARANSSRAIRVTEHSFRCIREMTQVRGHVRPLGSLFDEKCDVRRIGQDPRRELRRRRLLRRGQHRAAARAGERSDSGCRDHPGANVRHVAWRMGAPSARRASMVVGSDAQRSVASIILEASAMPRRAMSSAVP